MKLLHARFIRRQLSGAGSQAGLFLLCVALSMLALAALRGFGHGVAAALQRDARGLQAADVVVHAHGDFSPGLLAAAGAAAARGEIAIARTWEFYSMAAPAAGDGSLLVLVKAAAPGYPWYGEVALASGRPFAEVLRPGVAVVEAGVLGRLGLAVGDAIVLGGTSLRVADVVVRESDRPVTFFSLGPRVFVAAAELGRLGLVGRGSRVDHRLLVKVNDPSAVDRVAGALEAAARPDAERVRTYLTAGSGAQRFLENFLFFLTLIGTFTLLLAGIGVQSALTALLREKRDTVAILKALGAPGPFVVRQFVAVVAILGTAGTLLGAVGALALQALLFPLFAGLVPAGVRPSLSAAALLEGLAVGAIATAVFAVLPLRALAGIPPVAIFRRDAGRRAPGRAGWFVGAGATALAGGLVLAQARDPRTALWISGGLAALIALSALGAEALLRLARRLPVRSLALRQAVRGLFRPGNATRPVVVTLAAALALLLTIGLIERTLDARFVRSYPADAPNLFFLDLQPDQRETFARVLGRPAEYFPVVVGQVTAINGVAIDRERERKKSRDNFGRDFSLTYREALLDDELVVRGPGLFDPRLTGPQVSLLEEVLDMAPVALGDRLSFRVQGVPVEAVVASVRRRTSNAPRPFFYFVFPPSVLAQAPQTVFAAARVPGPDVVGAQNRVVAALPGVSVVDAGAAAAQLAALLGRVSRIVRLFTLLGIAAGALIAVSSVVATRRARVREAVYYRMLGARSSFVLRVFALEGLLIGLASGLIALALAQALTWGIVTWKLDLRWEPFWGLSLAAVGATVGVTVTLALAASVPVLRRRPADYLRSAEEQ